MNLNILKSIYLFREEIIIKLSEFLSNLEQLQTNKNITSTLQDLMSFIISKDQSLTQKEEFLFKKHLYMISKESETYSKQSFLKNYHISQIQTFNRIHKAYETYLKDKTDHLKPIFKQYYNKNNHTRMNSNPLLFIQQQKSYLTTLINNIQLLSQKNTNNKFNEVTTFFQKDLQIFSDLIRSFYSKNIKNIQFQIKSLNKPETQVNSEMNLDKVSVTQTYEQMFLQMAKRNKFVKKGIIQYVLYCNQKLPNMTKKNSEKNKFREKNQNTYHIEQKYFQNKSSIQDKSQSQQKTLLQERSVLQQRDLNLMLENKENEQKNSKGATADNRKYNIEGYKPFSEGNLKSQINKSDYKRNYLPNLQAPGINFKKISDFKNATIQNIFLQVQTKQISQHSFISNNNMNIRYVKNQLPIIPF